MLPQIKSLYFILFLHPKALHCYQLHEAKQIYLWNSLISRCGLVINASLIPCVLNILLHNLVKSFRFRFELLPNSRLIHLFYKFTNITSLVITFWKACRNPFLEMVSSQMLLQFSLFIQFIVTFHTFSSITDHKVS